MDFPEEIVTELSEIVSSLDWNALNTDSVIRYAEDFLTSLEINDETLAPVMALIAAFLTMAAVVFAFCFAVMLCAAVIGAIVCFVTAVYLFIQEYLLPAIALFRMARKAGYRHAWFAFVPFLQTVLEYVLPKKEFRVFFIRAPFESRFIFAVIAIAISLFGGAFAGLAGDFPVIGMIIAAMAAVVLPVFYVGFTWRKMYDLIGTYAGKKTALPISIIGLFVPLVYTISLLVYMNHEPDFGFGNYYGTAGKEDGTGVKTEAAKDGEVSEKPGNVTEEAPEKVTEEETPEKMTEEEASEKVTEEETSKKVTEE